MPPAPRAACALAALLLAVPLAGCAAPGAAPATGTGAAATASGTGHHPTNGTAAPRPPAPPRADQAHLLKAPLLNFTAPHGNETVIATKSPLAGAETYVWNFTVLQAANLTGAHTHAWLRVTQSSPQSGAANDPGCTLALTLVVRRNGTDAGYVGGCGSAGMGVLPPGDHLLEFAAPPGAVAVRVLPRDNVFLELTLAVEAPGLGATAFLMGGSSERDTWVRLDGLREPVLAFH